MLEKRNEHIFKDELVVLDYLVHQYKSELMRTTSEYGKIFKATRKTRLTRLRLEIGKLLNQIEKDLPNQFYAKVDEF